MNAVVGVANVLFVTLDCLRFDVARSALEEGRTPNLAAVLPPGGWEARETPGTFTLPAHLAFFHGFLPTPLLLPSPPGFGGGEGPGVRGEEAGAETAGVIPTTGPRPPHPNPSPPAKPGGEGLPIHPRLFALDFEGSLTITPETCVFRDVADIVAGFRSRGYRTFCVGGTGFFNKRNPLGHVLPGYFEESVWSPELGVAGRESARHQVDAALAFLASVEPATRLLLFVNVAATHPPHAFYLPGATADSPASQAAALASFDRELPRLFAELRRRGPCFCLVMADHGEAYGEDGRWGHRIAHPTVTTVPYAEFEL